MSFLILTTNLGWIQTTHYCLGRAVEANLGLEIAHLTCGMAMTSGCSEEMEQKPGCCHNEFDKFSLDQPLLVQALDFTPNLIFLVLPRDNRDEVFTSTFLIISKPIGFAQEEPPPNEAQLFMVYQQWLI